MSPATLLRSQPRPTEPAVSRPANLAESAQVQASGATASCLYECTVMHHRFSPRVHHLKHRIFLMFLDLDELPSLSQRLHLFGHNRRHVYSFQDSDHLALPGAEGLRASLTAWLASKGIALPADARVQLLTLPRVLGYVFNPVSFFFCSQAGGQPICAVAEVGNTFGELKPYLVPLDPGSRNEVGRSPRFRCIVPKEFYVSPFSDLQVCFDFRLESPGERLSLRVNDVQGSNTLLVSTVTGRRRVLTDGELLRLTLRYPLVTLRVIALIHWHALRLWLKRVPWHAKASGTGLQRGVFRPHASLGHVPPAAALPPPTST